MNYSLIKQLSRGKFFVHYSVAMNEAMAVFNALNGGDYEPRPDKLSILLISNGSQSVDSGDSDIKENTIAVVPLHGSMLKNGTLCSYGTQEIADIMLSIASEKNIIGIILDIDSGGGAVDSVAPMLEVIRKIQSELYKPVIAHCDLCASAAYWVACACDEIIATNNISAEFGSVGVMMSFVDVQPYYEKLGYVFHTFNSNLSPEKNDTFHKALKGEYDKIKIEELDPLARMFGEAVVSLRKGKFVADADEANLKGKTYFADKAKALGMIDSVGNLDSAISELKKLQTKYLVSNYLNQ
jgi:protease-4